MTEIEFTKIEKDTMVQKLQAYFREEMERNAGHYEMECLLDFISQEIGAYYYNCGLYDAHEVFQDRPYSVRDSIHHMKKPVRGY